ncbi:NUDIX domain-containing protein [Sodalis sp. (in: enterobacteria)]|uniref:NUDIX domain-containing protein n=1 Tax=Sodalis sp. (in: enterobacteria) TaxID=1898979 RepID=UPI003F3A3934
MFKPHVTVACVVQAESQFLVVEETIHGQPRWNQPAGHLEAHETLIEAAQRELWEEAGIHAQPQALLRIHQWIAPDNTPFLRFLFVIDLPRCVTAIPQDDDIDRCLWLPAETLFASDQLRSPLVAESLRCYQRGERLPLTFLEAFNWPF